MFKLLNRFAWGLSVVLSFLTLFLLGIAFDLLDDRYAFDDGTFIVWIILIAIFALLIRVIVFPRIMVREAMNELQKKAENKAELKDEEVELVFNTKEEQLDLKYSADKELSPDKLPEEPESLETDSFENTDAIAMSTQAEKIENKEFDQTRVPAGPNIIKRFFAEKPLAKIGGILLFLGVVFLLQLVYVAIGPVGKLLLGFVFAFAIFGIGVWLDKKEYYTESRVLLGTSILINYLVILSGRFLIGETMTDSLLLSETVTFSLLIANTLFAVVTALFYRSYLMLVFAIVFAYLNPFLIGAESSKVPYTLVAYSALVSVAAIFLSNKIRENTKQYSDTLFEIAFWAGNILFLIAPFSQISGWIIKLSCIALLSLGVIYNAYRNKNLQNLWRYFLGAYIFLTLLIGVGGVF